MRIIHEVETDSTHKLEHLKSYLQLDTTTPQKLSSIAQKRF